MATSWSGAMYAPHQRATGLAGWATVTVRAVRASGLHRHPPNPIAPPSRAHMRRPSRVPLHPPRSEAAKRAKVTGA
jgi:hypothetical protein